MLGGALSHLRSTRKLKTSSSRSPSVRSGLRRRLHLGIARVLLEHNQVLTPAALTQPPAKAIARWGGTAHWSPRQPCYGQPRTLPPIG